MIESTEIADRIYRISIWDDPCLAGMSFPATSYNMFPYRDCLRRRREPLIDGAAGVALVMSHDDIAQSRRSDDLGDLGAQRARSCA